MSPDPRTGLFSSSVHTQQTTDHGRDPDKPKREKRQRVNKDFDRRAERESFRLQPATLVEHSFRHGAWNEDREKVRAAMVAANVPASRLERFDACGADCVVDYSKSAGKYRVRATYCGDRFCIPCCVARSKRITAELVKWSEGCNLRFITLTVKKTDQSLQTIITHLLKSFYRLRRQEIWKNSVEGGAAVLEITRGAAGCHWHVHLHVLAVGKWIDQKQLSDGWRKASEGSYIVDVRAVKDNARGVGYVAKYATKGWSASVLEDSDALLECVVALRGRRLLIPFGTWYGREHNPRDPQPTDWKRIGRIGDIYRDALEKQPWAVAALRGIGFAAGRVNGLPTFVGASAPWSGP